MPSLCCCGPDETDVVGSSTKRQEDAVASVLRDIQSGESKIPTFNWRFRDGFGSVVLGPTAFVRLSRSIIPGEHNISTLELQGQQIRDEGAGALGTILSSDTKITALNLSKNDITEFGAVRIADALRTNVSLSKLTFDQNPIGSMGVLAVCKNAVMSTVLKRLELGVTLNQRLDDSAITALSVLLDESKLTAFSFNGNGGGLSPSGLASVLEPLERNHVLCALTLHNCVSLSQTGNVDLMVTAMNCLAMGITKSTSIRTISLRLPLGDPGARALSRGIAEAKCLALLDLARCGISDDGIVSIGDALFKNCSVTHLDISHQQQLQYCPNVSVTLTSKGMKAVAVAVSHNAALEHLYAANLPFDNDSVEVFIESLSMPSCVLHNMRHNIIDSDILATRLSNVLAANEAKRANSGPKSALARLIPQRRLSEFSDVDRYTSAPGHIRTDLRAPAEEFIEVQLD
jgi:hypothetical protein